VKLQSRPARLNWFCLTEPGFYLSSVVTFGNC
jgi:hypothetical protein